jgi:formate dehydrogenase subunit gamma
MMTAETQPAPQAVRRDEVTTQRTFHRFTLPQRWEHGLLIISFTALLVTGLPQKYFESWGHNLLTTPERLNFVRSVHHIFAVLLILEVIYHLGHNLYLMGKRRLPADIFPNMQDVRDAWHMVQYLLFLRRDPPRFGKYNFEQKFTYWFLFLAIGIMTITGIVLWFPIVVTRVLPGAVIPAAMLAHSNEAIAAAVFLVIWHFYHVHFERLNLSIFTGWLNEREMRKYHGREFQRLTGEDPGPPAGSEPNDDESS